MSHHFDSPSAIADGRIDLCDVFAFSSDPGTTALVLTVNPDAGRSSATTFRPDAVYEVAIATDGGTVADLALRVRFDEPDEGGQSLQVLLAEGDELGEAAAGRPVGRGRTDAVLALDLGGGAPAEGGPERSGARGQAWAGLAADPFVADGAALAGFLQAAAEGRRALELFDGDSNLFAGRDVTAVALQVPDALLGSGRVSVWAQITLAGHAPQQRVSRMGQPMLRPLFFPVPGPDTEALNAGDPGSDAERWAAHVRAGALPLVGQEVLDAEQHAAEVADRFLPDVLGYRAGAPGGWSPGGEGGRRLDDDTFATALLAVIGHRLDTRTPPVPAGGAFPHVAAPHRSALPPLAELFGLRAAPAAGA